MSTVPLVISVSMNIFIWASDPLFNIYRFWTDERKSEHCVDRGDLTESQRELSVDSSVVPFLTRRRLSILPSFFSRSRFLLLSRVASFITVRSVCNKEKNPLFRCLCSVSYPTRKNMNECKTSFLPGHTWLITVLGVSYGPQKTD